MEHNTCLELEKVNRFHWCYLNYLEVSISFFERDRSIDLTIAALSTKSFWRLKKNIVVVLNRVERSLHAQIAQIYIIKWRVCGLRRPKFSEIIQRSSVLFLQFQFWNVFKQLWLLPFFDKINVFSCIHGNKLLSNVPKVLNSLAVKNKRPMTVRTVVNVHFGKNIEQDQKRDWTKIHVVEVHYCNIFLIMIRGHFEIGDDEE